MKSLPALGKLLKDLRTSFGAVASRCEFEDEGATFDEAALLGRLSARSGLGLSVKIGGCEAITDMRQAVSIGAGTILAPMVETPYALSKFLVSAQNLVKASGRGTELFINIETITGVKNFPAMLRVPGIKRLTGIVIGRCDLAGSMGWGNDKVNDPAVFKIVMRVCGMAHKAGLQCSLGGGIGTRSIGFLQALPEGTLDFLETRKVVFPVKGKISPAMSSAILKATEFELLWLEYCRSGKDALRSDLKRIAMLEKRLSVAAP